MYMYMYHAWGVRCPWVIPEFWCDGLCAVAAVPTDPSSYGTPAPIRKLWVRAIPHPTSTFLIPDLWYSDLWSMFLVHFTCICSAPTHRKAIHHAHTAQKAHTGGVVSYLHSKTATFRPYMSDVSLSLLLGWLLIGLIKYSSWFLFYDKCTLD